MIVIHPTLISSPPSDEPLNYPTLGWHNIVSAGGVAASSADALYPASNLANPATYLYWQASATGAQTVDITFNSTTVDYLAICGHNFGTAGIAVTLQEGAGHTQLIASQSFSDDSPIIYRFVPGAKTTLRIAMAAGSAPARMAVVYVGKLTIFERGTQGGYTPLPFGVVNTIVNGESESGNFLGRIVTGAKAESKASFKYLSPSWYRAKMVPFVAASVNNPFFFAWQPVNCPSDCGFGWLSADPVPTIDQIGYFHLDLEMTGIVA